ncbi:MAG: DNA/RNA non-specific endonuclease, partial [Lachnospiraceae bacterium]|nr:DNA/RNA non-specific endonuclease [Lachnospiraceae bacterium]
MFGNADTGEDSGAEDRPDEASPGEEDHDTKDKEKPEDGKEQGRKADKGEESRAADGETGDKESDKEPVNEEGFSKSLVESDPSSIPEYEGELSIILNDNKPNFSNYDIENIKGEHYSELDELGRCGKAYAMLEKSLMPTEERQSIGQVKPTGWRQNKYP